MKNREPRHKIKIKAIIFDLGNVLLNYDIHRAIRRLCADRKVSIWKIWIHFLTSPTVDDYVCGRISCREFYLRAKRALRLTIDFQSFRKHWNDIFWENSEAGGIEELLVRLKRHYPLYLISNTNKMHFDYIRRKYKILRHFRKTFPSHEMGCQKPSLEIYQKVLKRIKLRPAETVFIDDVAKFVRAAHQVGMHAVRYRHKNQLIKALRELGVQF
ncbi:MAG: HAD family phosphatase [Candidatus Omnitrophica bacterium]|nr:HAD family phosphatase [Candidatus Omnitrophota bacterium]